MWQRVKIPRLIAICMPETPGLLSDKKKIVNHMLVDFASSMRIPGASSASEYSLFLQNF